MRQIVVVGQGVQPWTRTTEIPSSEVWRNESVLARHIDPLRRSIKARRDAVDAFRYLVHVCIGASLLLCLSFCSFRSSLERNGWKCSDTRE